MYYYVYDEFVQDPKHERELASIETRLTDLGVSGKIARLALFRDPTELIRDEVRKGAETIVAVGNDVTLRQVIDAVADSGVAVGIIPLGKGNNKIADMLGVPIGVAACDVISARIIEEVDIGVVNGLRFLHSLVIDQGNACRVLCDNKFTLSLNRKGTLEIRNLALADDTVRAANPTDGKLEIVIRGGGGGWFFRKKHSTTILPVEEALIQSKKPVILRADGESFQAKEFRVSIIPNRIRLITGRERKF
jgi:diacylglycerol kinase family enzyme